MTSNKPYFIRALYEWILDNRYTPHLLVDATLPYVSVPEEFITDGKIILNILPSAIQNLVMSNDWISFSARFRGISQNIELPIGSIMAIYAQENGQGMGFEVEALTVDEAETIAPSPDNSVKKPSLSIVSKEKDSAPKEDPEPPSPTGTPKNTRKKKSTTSLKVIK